MIPKSIFRREAKEAAHQRLGPMLGLEKKAIAGKADLLGRQGTVQMLSFRDDHHQRAEKLAVQVLAFCKNHNDVCIDLATKPR